MKLIRYSKSTGAFYPLDIQYESLPGDLIKVPYADFEKAMLRPTDHGFNFDNGPLEITSPSATDIIKQENSRIMGIIQEIEATRQPRAIRDFLITKDDTWLKKIDSDISELRSKLK